MRKLLIVICFLCLDVNSHSGGIDSNGGHVNKKTGDYHCHPEPCLSNSTTSSQALEEAKSEHRPYTMLYNREDWKHWSDTDFDCMNTRHEILLEQADGEVRLSPDGCYVSMSVWNDPYSGKQFTRASDLDIDHVITVVCNMI